MKIKDWHIFVDNEGKKNRFYGDLEDYDEKEFAGLRLVKKEEWTAIDYEIIAAAILENSNKHKMLDFPEKVFELIKKEEIDATALTRIMKGFTELLEQMYQ